MVNVVLGFAVVALLGLFAFYVRISPPADHVAVLITTGMTGSCCSATIEKVLQAKKGVASVEVDVKKGLVVIGYDANKIRPEELAATVTGAGYGSRVQRLLTVEQYRTMTGRYPGQGMTTNVGCGCGTRNDKQQ